MLLHVPIIGGWVERRWMPDPVERDRHREVVRERLEAPIIPAPPQPGFAVGVVVGSCAATSPAVPSSSAPASRPPATSPRRFVVIVCLLL